MGPTLPKYIVTMIISFPKVLSVAVRFLESPTVAVALGSKNESQNVISEPTEDISIG